MRIRLSELKGSVIRTWVTLPFEVFMGGDLDGLWKIIMRSAVRYGASVPKAPYLFTGLLFADIKPKFQFFDSLLKAQT